MTLHHFVEMVRAVFDRTTVKLTLAEHDLSLTHPASCTCCASRPATATIGPLPAFLLRSDQMPAIPAKRESRPYLDISRLPVRGIPVDQSAGAYRGGHQRHEAARAGRGPARPPARGPQHRRGARHHGHAPVREAITSASPHFLSRVLPCSAQHHNLQFPIALSCHTGPRRPTIPRSRCLLSMPAVLTLQHLVPRTFLTPRHAKKIIPCPTCSSHRSHLHR